MKSNYNLVSNPRGQGKGILRTSDNLGGVCFGESSREGSERISVKVVSIPDWSLEIQRPNRVSWKGYAVTKRR